MKITGEKCIRQNEEGSGHGQFYILYQQLPENNDKSAILNHGLKNIEQDC
jgi:hypothetical protein